jgi:hypothetical protein
MSAQSLPPDYVQVDRWTLGGASVWVLLAVAVACLVLAYLSVVVIGLVQLALTGSASFSIPGEVVIPGGAAGIVVGIALHELAHAIGFMTFGARPGFGFKPWVKIGPVFWVSAPGCYLNKAEFATAALLPPVLLTALLPIALTLAPAGSLAYGIALFAYFFGVSGSAGDVVMLKKVMSYPRGSLFEDTGEGFTTFALAGSEETQ